jgi:hypothetical protein
MNRAAMTAVDYAAARISNCSAREGLGLKANLACRFRIMWTISMPDRMMLADAMDLKPTIGRAATFDGAVVLTASEHLEPSATAEGHAIQTVIEKFATEPSSSC